MYWNYNTTTSPQIESLLTKENVTLQEVLEYEEIINECKVQNKTLMDFLQKPEIMEELVTLITKEPSIELDEKTRFKYPNVACELLTCDLPALNERLARDEVLLDKLYKFLENEPPLNPLLASYFSKIMGVLIAKKTEQNWLSYQFTCLQVLDFLKAKDNFISLLLKHLGTSAIMDLMLKLMTQVEGGEMRQNILNWLDSQRVMQSLVSVLNPKMDKEKHYNVAQLLCDFIRTARDTQRNSTERADPDPLLNTLESPETVTLLLENILDPEKCETAILGGIQVLLSLLDVYQNSIPKFNTQNMYSSTITEEASEIEQKQKIIYNTTQAIQPRVKDFHNLLLEPPKQPPILTTIGVLNPPFGITRLQVMKLFAALIATNNEDLLAEIESCGTFKVMLDLFFKYEWNNFLHTQVENCLIASLKNHISDENEENSNALTKHLLVNCKIIERFLDAWKENDVQQFQENRIRKGYMGHLISIVNKIVELCSTTSLGQYIKNQLPETAKYLEEFKETTLSETNKIQATLLGGAPPNTSVSENEDYGDVPFPQSNALQQQMFSHYQVQNLATYIDNFSGFSDDAFNDGDDTLQTIDHRTDMNFDLSESDLAQQREMFKQVCAQNINTLDDADDQIFEDKEHTFQTVIEKQDGNEPVYSSDSDDELADPDYHMEVDPWLSPKPPETSSSPISSDPWSSETSAQRDSTNAGWADFGSATFETSFNDVFAKGHTNADNKASVHKGDMKVDHLDDRVDISSNNTKMDNVSRVAQTEMEKGDVSEEKMINAAGDSSDKRESFTVSESTKGDSTVTSEPSKSIGVCSIQSESTDKEKVEKDKV